MHPNKYGRFIEDGQGYEITDHRTPRPWTNVVSNGRYGFVISQNGGGFSFLYHCQLNVLTRWTNDHLHDDQGRFIYLADLDEPDTVWSVTPHPCRTNFDAYRCIHRAGSTTFESSAHGISATWTLGVAPRDQAELWTLTLTNDTDRPRRIRLGAFFQWCCDAAPDSAREFHKLFFTTRYDEKRHAIFATKNLWNAPFGTPDDHWNRPWPYVAGLAMPAHSGDQCWATSDTESFLGRDGDERNPQAMTGTCTPSFGRFGDACAALGTDLQLAPGQSVTRTFILGITEDKPALEAMFDRYATLDAVKAALDESAQGWTDRLSPTRVESASADFDLLNNHWLPYQAISARLWARTGYYQQSGAFGFRDQLQDSQVWLHRQPEKCREQILLHAAHQFADGSVYHWWNPLTETGLHDNCSDDYLWLPFILAAYIRETGDTGILDETVPFVDDETPATLASHAKRSIDRALWRQSERGLPLIGDNDWNDGLSALGTDTAGESVWVAFFLMTILDDFGRALLEAGDTQTPEHYAAARSKLQRAVDEYAWDGQWYRRATDATGRWLGSNESAEGKIFLNAQTWAIFAGASDDERLDQAWDAAKTHLLTPYGPLLLAPAYTKPDHAIGYLTRYAPGSRENGGVYMHAATWALAAACKRKDVEAAAQIWNAISPPARSAKPDAYAAEPYVLPGNVDGPLSTSPGRAGWTWYTGSAAWLNRICIEHIIGARATWDGLTIDPCPPAQLGSVTATRRWRGRNIHIAFDATDFDPANECVVTLNGRPLVDNTITESMIPPGTSAQVAVRWVPQDQPTPEILVPQRERSKT